MLAAALPAGPVEGHLTNSWEPAYRKEHQFTRQEITNTVTAAFDELDFEYATSVAEKAMRSMAEQRVPPTPNNFHVWFKYTLGTPPVLKRAIDILIGNKRKFDAQTNREIYESYIGSKAADEAVAYEVSQQLHSVMASAKQFLTTAIADNRTQMACHQRCRRAHRGRRRSQTADREPDERTRQGDDARHQARSRALSRNHANWTRSAIR